MVIFKEINEDNYEAVINMEISEAQKESRFVAPNVKSLADAYLYRHANDVFPYAVQDGDEVVGFVLLDEDVEEKEFMIWRMMVDKNHQGKGYGRAIVEQVISMFKSDHRFDVLIADYVKGNEVMGNLLSSLGFEYHSFDDKLKEYVMHYKMK